MTIIHVRQLKSVTEAVTIFIGWQELQVGLDWVSHNKFDGDNEQSSGLVSDKSSVMDLIVITNFDDLKGHIVILFTGSKDDGKSWCPDCIQAAPIIEKVIKEIASSDDTEDLTFVECGVGKRIERRNYLVNSVLMNRW
ncbi:hypothetical protein DINM_002810 [Dirofilaria immitis]|nr:hypothetical protein [Dirofilaria immitis]